MSGRFIVLVIAAAGWLLVATIAYAFISLFGFFGVGFFGLLLLFICMQVGLESNGGAGRSASPPWAGQDMSRRARALHTLRHSLLTTRFFIGVGIALTAVGFGGFLYFQLG